jgi:hypothetical protein
MDWFVLGPNRLTRDVIHLLVAIAAAAACVETWTPHPVASVVP